MIAEYLLFDLVVAAPLVLAAWLRPRWFRGGWRAAFRAALFGAIPFVVWDAAVAGRHWWFDARRVLGPRVLGLPVEELLFFLVVPLACLFTWEVLVGGARARLRPLGRAGRIAALVCLLAAVWAWAEGREYTALVLAGVVGALVLDDALGTGLAGSNRARVHAVLVLAFTGVFNGYLTARPIVHYDDAYALGWRLGTIPVEDFAFGLALVLVTTTLYQRARGRRARPSWLGRAIGARFGGYRHAIDLPDPDAPARSAVRHRVAVIGAGLAGLTAAEVLARRGFAVTLFERDAKLGGKLAGWSERLPDGFVASIEHGFHAFFRQYYNLRAWLERLDIAARLCPIDDYVILARDGRRFSFAGLDPTPVLNLLALATRGVFRIRDVLPRATSSRLELLLRYHPHRTHAQLDGTSFAEFADAARLPPALRLVFTTFARAFFADEQRLSMAELAKSFHFYYLGHDRGLLYDYLDGSYAEAFVAPIEAALVRAGVTIRTSTPVTRLDNAGKEARWRVAGSLFDHVVLAADVGAASRIVGDSPALRRDHPELAARMAKQHAGQRYAVLRLWLDRAVAPRDWPVFVAIEGATALDAVAFVDRTDTHSREWAHEHGGSVLELHCYAVPDELRDDEVAARMQAELAPQLHGFASATIVHRHLQLRRDFTALHVGMGEHRPGVQTGVPGLVLAGDWVRLPCPAMLMEAAHTAGLFAANAICREHGVGTDPVWSVPLQGLLAAP
jgi:isorenieratene synthase